MVCSSRCEKTSAKMSTNSSRAGRVCWVVSLVRRSLTQVISIPSWEVDGEGVVEGLGVVDVAGFAENVAGVVVPASAMRDAWWLTLNSTVGVSPGRAEVGMKHGRWCGGGVLLMVILSHGMRQARWMKRYLRR